jgi:hypothetical protein
MSTIISDLVSHLQCGESIALNDSIYIDSADGRVYKFDATDTAQVFAGIAKEAGLTSAFIRVVQSGRVKGFSGLTPGAFVYASISVPGSLQLTEPTASLKVILGIAKSATELVINGALGIKTGGAGSGAAGSVDTLLTQTFDEAAIIDFTQVGLDLAVSPRINGLVTARLIHQVGINQSLKQTIAVDPKYRGKLMQVSLQDRSTASEGNLILKVRNETGAADLIVADSIQTDSQSIAAISTVSASAVLSGFSNSVINSLSIGMSVTGAGIPTGTVIDSIDSALLQVTMSANATASASVTIRVSALPLRRVFSFTAPKDCASLSYTITALPEADLPESYIDDLVIQLASTALLETSVTVPVITAWQSYTPTFQGFGSPSAIEMQWRQNGQNAEIRGKFTSGVATAVEARIGLPAGLSSAGVGVIPSLQIVGVGGRSINTSTANNLLIEPSVTYLTLGQSGSSNPLAKQPANAVVGNADLFSFFASVPCAGLSATVDKVIPLTQSGLIQEADSMIRLNTHAGFGSTNTVIPRFTNLVQNIGLDILYQDSASAGASFTILTSGVYDFTFGFGMLNSSAVNLFGLSKNSTQLTTSLNSITVANRLSLQYSSDSAVSEGLLAGTCNWSGYLVAGDIIRPHTSGLGPTTAAYSHFTATKQGSLKQVSVSSDQKIKIPTSELRFEGASSRGTGAEASTLIFTTLAKIRGDAFSVDSSNGTIITMLKAGKLDISSSVFTTQNVNIQLVKNGSAISTQAGNTSGGNQRPMAVIATSVQIGDVLKVYLNGNNPTTSTDNYLQLYFQEQDISVSVTNTLPQFSDSDSSVRVDTANGYGSTGTKIRRFSNVRDNLGVDVEYVDSAVNGASFTAKSDGIYHITYGDLFNAAQWMGITKNSSALSTGLSGSVLTEVLSYTVTNSINQGDSVSWQGELIEGDVIRAHSDGATPGTNGTMRSVFTMSKVGKPNVTGVDVTPFVNIPQPESQSSRLSTNTNFGGGGIVSGVLTSDTANGLYSYNSATGVYTALKTADFNLSLSIQALAASSVLPLIKVNNSFFVAAAHSVASTSFYGSCSASIKLNAGEFFRFENGAAGANNQIYATVLATALSDQILTVPETFSTDTAALSYAGSAEYTLATLENAPVGKYITFTYAASTNTRVPTTVRPTQLDSHMNANGIQIFARAYNAASTAGNPAAIAIQIGKGLKGVASQLYGATGKVDAGTSDFYNYLSNVRDVGIFTNSYNERTGILYLDAGYASSSGVTTHFIGSFAQDGAAPSYQTNGYLVINASKNPALVGISLPRVYSESAGNAGQVITANVTNIPFIGISDTNGAWNGSQYVVPETGVYSLSGMVFGSSFTGNIELWVGGVTANGISSNPTTSTKIFSITKRFNKGDTLSFRSTATTTLVSSATYNHLEITKVSN